MIALHIVQLIVHRVADPLCRSGDAIACIMRRILAASLHVSSVGSNRIRTVVTHCLRSIFRIAPSLFGRALYLICYARVRKSVVADGFPNGLFDLACYLIEFSFCFV